MSQGRMDYSSAIRDIAPANLKRIKQTITLTKEAKLRLSWLDYYHSHKNNAALTCRYFGISRSCFFKWKKRYNLLSNKGLLSHSRRPSKVRSPLTAQPVVSIIKYIRKSNPEYSKYKLAVILKRDYGYSISASTIGRIISRYNLFYTSPIKPKKHPGRLKSANRIRKPINLSITRPGQLVEADVKHLPNLGSKRYGFVAIDVFTKQATIHVASTISSSQGAIAWKKAVHKLGLPEAIVTDNGSENYGAFEQLVATQPVEHYWAKPRTPKDKPHVERFIGSLERECIQWGGVATDLSNQQDIINQWLDKYHNYRPHQSLGYLTPNEYKQKIEAEVSSMY